LTIKLKKFGIANIGRDSAPG